MVNKFQSDALVIAALAEDTLDLSVLEQEVAPSTLSTVITAKINAEEGDSETEKTVEVTDYLLALSEEDTIELADEYYEDHMLDIV